MKTFIASHIFYLLLYISSTFAAPIQGPIEELGISTIYSNACRKDTEHRKLSYEDDKEYSYAFQTTAITSWSGISTQENKIEMKGVATLVVGSDCNFGLIVREANLVTSNGQVSSEIKKLENTFIQFWYNDGLVEDSISIAEDDPPWSVNIKRTIISLFNNQAVGLHNWTAQQFMHNHPLENDVSGTQCKTRYAQIDGNEFKFSKSKDLNRCGNRDGGFSVGQGIRYQLGDDAFSENEYLSDTLINSRQTCEQNFTTGILQTASCKEIHKLDLLSTEHSGVQVISHTTVTYAGSKKGGEGRALLEKLTAGSTIKKSSIYFDHSQNPFPLDNKDKVIGILDKMCAELRTTGGATLTSEIPAIFLDLKASIRSTTAASLLAIYNTLKSSPGEAACGNMDGQQKKLKLFLDASAMAATTDSIVFMTQLLNNGVNLPEKTQNSFYLFISFADKPKEEALKAIGSRIGKDATNMKLLLGASGLAHQFCQSRPNCASSEQYNNLVSLIANVVKTNYLANDEAQLGKAVSALQALGNLDSLTETAITTINDCLTKGQEPRIRIAALQAFRRNPCQEKLKLPAKRILENQSISSDLRIHAYLALTRCLTRRDVDFISIVFQKEQVNQVKSFITTHRTNILYSSKPTKFHDKTLYKAMNTWTSSSDSQLFDPRKYSTNFESTSFDENSNFGYTFDSDLIYSQNSFLPKSLSSNVSLYFVGKSYNLFECGVNFGDFDSWSENLFGPKSATSQTKWKSQPAEQFKPSASASRNKNLPSFDQKNIQRFQNQVKIPANAWPSGTSDLYIRVLGTTIYSQPITMQDILETTTSATLSPTSRFTRTIIDLLQNGQIDMTEPIPLISDELIVPTISGFPLHLELKSTAIVTLKWKNQMSNNWRNIESVLAPSTSMLMRGKLSLGGIDGPIIESGLQIETKAHQSSQIELKSTFSPGPSSTTSSFSYETKIKLTDADKVAKLEAKNNIYWIERVDNDGVLRKTNLVSKFPLKVNIENKCSATIGQYVGLALCASVKIPELNKEGSNVYPEMSPLLPVSVGPTELSLSLERTDKTLKEFLVKVDYGMNEKSDASLRIVIDTPGSATNRKIYLNSHYVYAGQDERSLEIQIDSPWENIHVSELMKTNPDSESQTFLIKYGGQDYKLKRDTSWKQEPISNSKFQTSRNSVITYKPPGQNSKDFDVLKFQYNNVHESMQSTGLKIIESNFDAQANIPLIGVNGKTSGTIIFTTKRLGGSSDDENVIAESGYFKFDPDNRFISTEFKNVVVTSSHGAGQLNGIISRNSDGPFMSLIDLNVKYGKKTDDEQSLVLYSKTAATAANIAEDFSSELKLVSSQLPQLNFDGKWKSSINPRDSSVKLSLEANHRPEDKNLNSSIVLNIDSVKLADGADTKLDFQVSSPAQSVDILLQTDSLVTSSKTNILVNFKFGSLLSSATKFELDKETFGYNFNTKNEFNEQTLLINSQYDAGQFNALLQITPENFYIDMVGNIDRKIDDQTSLDKVNVRVNSSALANGQQLLTFDYELEARGQSTYFILLKALAQLQYGQNDLGKFVFEKLESQHNPRNVDGVNLEIYIIKLIKTQLKVESERNEGFVTSFHGAWYPTRSEVNIRLAGNSTSEAGIPVTKIFFKLDNGTPTRFFEWNSSTKSYRDWFDSTNNFNIHGSESVIGMIIHKSNEQLRGKPSLLLTFQSPERKAYKWLFSTDTKYQFQAKLVHLLLDLDLGVTLPDRKPFDVHYLIELKKENLEEKFLKFLFNTKYETTFQDPQLVQYSDMRVGMSIDVDTKEGRGWPAIILQVQSNNIDHKLNLITMKSKQELLALDYECNDTTRAGNKLFNFHLDASHDSKTNFPKEMNQLKLNTKFENFATKSSGAAGFLYKYKYVRASKLGSPEFQLKSLEIHEEGSASFTQNGQKSQLKSLKILKFAKHEVYVKLEDILNDKALGFIVPNFEVHVTHHPNIYKSALQISNGKLVTTDVKLDENNNNDVDGVIFDVTFNFDKSNPMKTELAFSLAQALSSTWYRNTKLKIHHKHDEEQPFILETLIEALINENILELTNKLNLRDMKNDLVILKNGVVDKRLYVGYKDGDAMAFAEDQGPSFDVKLQWGPLELQTVTSTGTMLVNEQGYTIRFLFNNPEVFEDKWVVDISKTSNEEKRYETVSLWARAPTSPKPKTILLLLQLDKIDLMSNKLSFTYEFDVPNYAEGARKGKAEILAQSKPNSGLVEKINFKLEDSINNQTSRNISLYAKSFEKISLLNCDSDGKCDSLEILVDAIKFEIIGEREGLKSGLRVDQGNQLAEIWYPSHMKQQHIGIRPILDSEASSSDLYYIKSDIPSAPDFAFKAGIELTLSERTILLALVQAKWENRQLDAETYEVGLWMDHLRKPDERIGFGIASISADVGKDADQGRNVILHFGHPEIWKSYQKNLRISAKYRYGITYKVFNLESEFDIFKRAEDKFVLQAQLNHKVLAHENLVFAIDLVAESKGQNLGFETHCKDIVQQTRRKTANCDIKILSAGKGERLFNFNYKFDADAKLLEFKRTKSNNEAPDEHLLYYNYSKEADIMATDPFNGDQRRFPKSKATIRLPGMTDYRINEQTFNENPYGYSTRTYPSSTPDQYTEVWFGKLASEEYGLGFASVANAIRNNIMHVSNPRKGRLVYTLKFNWDKETLKAVLTRLQARISSTTNLMAQFLESQEDLIGTKFDIFSLSTLRSLPEFDAMYERHVKELSQIMVEQDIPYPESTIKYLENIWRSLISNPTAKDTSIIAPAGQSTSFMRGLAARITGYGQLISGVIQGIKQSLDKDVDSSKFYNEDTENEYLNKVYANFATLSQIRDNIIELESKQELLKKIITSVKSSLLKRFQSFYKSNIDDVQDLFPYAETETFTKSLKTYMEKRLFGNDNNQAIRDDFGIKLHLFLQKVFEETLYVNLKAGVFQISFPEITRTKFVRRLMRPSSSELAPPSLPLKFWLHLLINRDEALPPISGKGLIIGSSYFQTLDRIIRRFSDTCQYVLASDFVGKNFTVAIDLKLESKLASETPTRNIIFTNHEDVVILSKDSQIFFNGIQVPESKTSVYLGEHFKAYRDDSWVVIRGDMGVQIGCSLKMDVCALHVSGYYFGKIRGVMGSFNNEGQDDFLLPTGKVSESANTFLRAWKLNSECRQQTVNKYIHNIPNYIQLAKTFPS